MILVQIFIPISFVEPAYLIYRIDKVCQMHIMTVVCLLEKGN